MSGVLTNLTGHSGHASIVVLDEAEDMRRSVVARLSAEFQSHNVRGFASEAQVKEEVDLSSQRTCVIVASYSWYRKELSNGAWHGSLVSNPGDASYILYGDDMTEDDVCQVIESGAFTAVPSANLETAIHGFLIVDELVRGRDGFTVANAIFNRANMGISILNPQMEVLWMNARKAEIVEDTPGSPRPYWLKYHNFRHRTSACPDCTVNRVLHNAIESLQHIGSVADGRLTGEHLLPVSQRTDYGHVRKLECIEVNAAPMLSHNGTKVLAIIEASRLITDRWENYTEAHKRLKQVIEMARRLGMPSEEEVQEAVSVFYRPEGTAHFHLFESTATDGNPARIKVLRLADCDAAYSQVVERGGWQFFNEQSANGAHRHFLWVGNCPKMDCKVLIDVTYDQEKPDGLLYEDLRPYWEYVVDVFGNAWIERENELNHTIDRGLQGIARLTTTSIRDEKGLDQAVENLIQCIKSTIQPFSAHARVFDHRSGNFVLRGAFGPYSEIVPHSRRLTFGGIGSSKVAETRKAEWCGDADVTSLCFRLDRAPTSNEQRTLQQITSTVDLPLISGDFVLGTLCVQFDDDSFFSDVKRKFVETITDALGAVLGNRRWAVERAAIIERSNELDDSMFKRSTHPEEEEARVITSVMRMVFDLTAGELVAFYRYDRQIGKLFLAPDVEGSLPEDASLVSVLNDTLGVVGLAAKSGNLYLADDFRGGDWQGVRDAVLRSLAPGPERRFCEWVGSLIAAPVIADSIVKGVLVTFSSMPRWLNPNDVGVIRELAGKMGLWLAAKDLTRRLNWHERTKISLNYFTGRMACVSDENVLYRSYLVCLTTDECLGFNRAVVFRRVGLNGTHFAATDAIGQSSVDEARKRWDEARLVTLDEKLKACHQPVLARDGDLAYDLNRFSIDIHSVEGLSAMLNERRLLVRRQGESHILTTEVLKRLSAVGGSADCEYILVPIRQSGELVAFIYADRPFVPPAELQAPRLELTELLTGEFALMMEALKLRENQHKASVAEELAQRISYTFRTRAAGLAARIQLLPEKFRNEYSEDVEGLLRSVRFFDRAGTNASRAIRLDEIGIRDPVPVRISDSIDETLAYLQDPRIDTSSVDRNVRVRTEQHLLSEALLEVVFNACEFAPHPGEVRITVGRNRSSTA